MIIRSIFALVSAVALLAGAAASEAQIPRGTMLSNEIVLDKRKKGFRFRGTFWAEGNPNIESQRGAKVQIGFEGFFSIGLLVGDPVVSVRMRFRPLSGKVTIPSFEPGKSSYRVIGLSDLPTEALEQIDLHQVEIAFRMNTGRDRGIIVEDSGVFFGQGKWSFNVPDGYSWRDLLFDGDIASFSKRGARQIGEGRAKAMWKAGMQFDAFRVLGARLLLSDLHHWYAKHDTASEYFATLRAIDRLKDGIQKSYGFKIPATTLTGVLDAMEILQNAVGRLSDKSGQAASAYHKGDGRNYMRDFERAVVPLRVVLRKLQNLPQRFRKGSNHGPYRQALRDVDTILSEPRQLRRAFRAEGPRNSGVRRGKPPRFGGVYAERKIDGDRWLVETSANNRKVRRLESGEYLLGDAYLLSRRSLSRQRCVGRKVAIPLHDPKTKEQVSSVSMPCYVSDSYPGVSRESDKEGAGLLLSIQERPSRKVRKTVRCRACGRTRSRSGTVTEFYYASFALGKDLSIRKTGSSKSTSGDICPALVLCAKKRKRRRN
ncbi:MAG: hypothetical protein AAF441_22565 [Pseudomonadota bacterium]